MRVLIVDDHPIVASGCRALLGHRDFEWLEARTAKEGLEAFEQDVPAVVVIDINLPDASGFDLARRILERDPAAGIVFLSMNDDPVFVREALDIGARGFVSKHGDPRLLETAIDQVQRGESFLPDAIAERLATAGGRERTLTAREVEIARLLGEGSSLAEIAAAMNLSYKTVAQCCTSARLKIGARTPVELVKRALELKLI